MPQKMDKIAARMTVSKSTKMKRMDEIASRTL